ncbi:MAG: FAD:protein FMN transferase [Pseudotabrizicola sp.]|uniref:FAD:protein FMN transferase n=1 Tax=Pseudotabrizicola sp. TaxID=2939647 RepID=UPI00272339BD|nr:FAD:protein FMN transferase [Pseudotabrizicola sp.]MDO8882704.1 FAD:protein FMN transferase [Pseudotabrizicola sp.]MDP2079729.1 FAD:protein FMN transferase [Pseudotabrizicola sp.]MDZ7575684.1 FAD:protein FMN transferase [Pseudotabrizicola sp.]
MLKMFTDLARHALNGATMGTRWSALFYAPASFNPALKQTALQQAVDEVDDQMSTWKPDSALMRLNAAPVGEWVEIPARLAEVLQLGVRIGRESGGAFDIGMGNAVQAWGFGPEDADQQAIRAAMTIPHRPGHKSLELDGTRVRKTAPVTLDLNGIAKGYGVDRMAEVLVAQGVDAGLVGIDGEMRALGLRPDGEAWTIAVEAPDTDRRAPHSILALRDAAVATSGDYRHWVMVQGCRLSHTMDPARAAPLLSPPASVTVIASSCAEADAWATALMVAGPKVGSDLAEKHGLEALFLLRDSAGGVHAKGVGRLFDQKTDGNTSVLTEPERRP